MNKSVSIIIPAWNEEKIILKTCEFIEKVKLPFKYSELIFIAGGNDNTYNVCKSVKLTNFNELITIKQNPGDFKSGALIKGIKRAKGDYIILSDADVFMASNTAIEIAKALKKFDAVCCDFIPLIQKGFWYNYYTIFKLIWSKNPNNLHSLIGGATISIRKEIFKEIGIEHFFTNETTAGVDYYMGLILIKNKKRIGFIKNARVLVPRPNNLKDFVKDQKRWLTAFFSIHQKNRFLILSTLILNILYCLFPPLILLTNLRKMMGVFSLKYPNLKLFITLFFIEFMINLISVFSAIKLLMKRIAPIGHFKGEDRYLY